MKNVKKIHAFNKVNAITEEISASFNFITLGLLKLREQNSFESNNHVALQLFASGFERVLKILLVLKEKHLTGKYPEHQIAKSSFKKYDNGHGIEKMLDELILYSKTKILMQQVPKVARDLKFIENDKSFRKFITIVSDFAISQRYYYIDTIVLENYTNSLNPFARFKGFIYSTAERVDLTKLTYEQEDRLMLKNAIICIEKAARAISHFFAYGLGETGTLHSAGFADFGLLDDKDLGTLKYTEMPVLKAASYKPIGLFSFKFLQILLLSKSKALYSSDFPEWVFTVDRLKVYSMDRKLFFAKIGNKVFALTTTTQRRFRIPTYFSSDKLKPKAHALFLLEEAKRL